MSIATNEARPPRLVLRFAVFTAIGLAFAAGVILLVVRHIVTVEAETSATRHARFVTDAILAHELESSDLATPVVGPRRGELDRLFSEEILVDGNLLVKLTRADGLVTYSTDHALIGSAAPDVSRIREALAGSVVSDVAQEGADPKILRAYVPLRLAGAEKPGVVVIHQDYGPIADAAKAAFFPIAGVLEALLVLLFAALVPIMGRVTSRVRNQMKEIEYRAFHDDLTDLPNRALFRDRIEQAILAAKRGKHEVGVVLIDIDRFKEINDTLGHGSGDALLQELATRLRDVLREGETFARLGGDEFGIALPTIMYPEAGAVAERVQEALHEPFVIRGLSLVIEASMGIATYPRDAEDADTLIQRADIAMYLAKEARSGYALYDADQDTNDPSRLALLGELRRAIEEEKIVLHFQPQAELRTGAIRGVEALVRWQHPERGLLGPHEFIPLAEHTGLIKPLSRYVLESALRQLCEWSEQGVDLDVAVNLTMPDLLDLELPNDLERLLAASGLSADRLELEITESTIMADPFRTREVLDRLDEMGIKLAIDDFGTGYSSLAYLKRLPVHQLKIDRSFVMNMASDSNDRTVVRSTIDLARNLGLKVVAEGVEDAEQWRDLRAFGCDYAQGYLLSKPLPGPELLELVRSWAPALPVAVSV